MSLVQINWNPNVRELRKFGATMIVSFILIGLTLQFWPWTWPFHRNPGAALVCYLVGVTVGLWGLTGTRSALVVYWIWMGIAFTLGNIISRIMLAVLYYGMITPMGVAMRLMRRDILGLRPNDRGTHWMDVRYKAHYERQF